MPSRRYSDMFKPACWRMIQADAGSRQVDYGKGHQLLQILLLSLPPSAATPSKPRHQASDVFPWLVCFGALRSCLQVDRYLHTVLWPFGTFLCALTIKFTVWKLIAAVFLANRKRCSSWGRTGNSSQRVSNWVSACKNPSPVWLAALKENSCRCAGLYSPENRLVLQEISQVIIAAKLQCPLLQGDRCDTEEAPAIRSLRE